MKKPKLKRANESQAVKYWNQTPQPCYELHGWIEVDGHKCAVEYLAPARHEVTPKYEVIYPTGFSDDNGWHSLLSYDMKDFYDRLEGRNLTACAADCDCHFDIDSEVA